MTWQVFGGEHNELYLALQKQRCKNDGLPVDTFGLISSTRQLMLDRALVPIHIRAGIRKNADGRRTQTSDRFGLRLNRHHCAVVGNSPEAQDTRVSRSVSTLNQPAADSLAN